MLSPKIKFLNKLKKFNVPRFTYYKVEDWTRSQKLILNYIKNNFNKEIAVRSACIDEDNKISNAGKYRSILKINSQNSKEVVSAINEVISSFGKKKGNSFIIQEMINNVKVSGVVFTKDPNSGFPITIINYIKSNRTDLITSGEISGNQHIYLNHQKVNIKPKNKFINDIKKKILEIIKLTKLKNLDIEFCIDKKNKFYLLQCRPLKINTIKKYNINELYRNYYYFYRKLNKILPSNNFLIGKKTFFSTMTDWNPAEMIGLKPRKLTSSLYKELISDEVWSKSRKELGYKDVEGVPLIKMFLGTPYVDIKADFNSFLSDKLDYKIQTKIMNYYISEFSKKPNFYFDKVESNLIFNCIDFDSKSKLLKLKIKANLSNKEINKIRKSYLDITNNFKNQINLDLKKVKNLDIEINKIIKDKKNHPINKIYNLVINIKKYGTLPFSNLARMAFVSVSLLDSMVKKKIITEEEKFQIINSNINFSLKSLKLVSKGNKKKFYKYFGHLRPSTYDITVKNYKDGFRTYFGSTFHKPVNIIKKNYSFTKKQKKLINKEILSNKLKYSFKSLINFIIKSIYFREESKRVFSRGIDQIFKEMKILSKKINIPINDFSFLDIQSFMNLYNNFDTDFIKTTFLNEIKVNKYNYKRNQVFKLPDVILRSDDIFSYDEKIKNGTYLGFDEIIKEIIVLNKKFKKFNLKNKIVCIENADPGYDFIFSHKIAGLITAYGGPNSHMCIRCNELGIPACIGVGKSNFNMIKVAKVVSLNCNNKKIEIIQ